MIKYDKSFRLMEQKGITAYQLRMDKVVGQSALTAMKKGGHVSTSTIDNLCKYFGCQPGDLMEYRKDDE